MNINDVKEFIRRLNLDKWKLMQTDLNDLVLFKVKYKYTDCIYMNLVKEETCVRYERVFDNKYVHMPIERLLISRNIIKKENDFSKHIIEIINKEYYL